MSVVDLSSESANNNNNSRSSSPALLFPRGDLIFPGTALAAASPSALALPLSAEEAAAESLKVAQEVRAMLPKEIQDRLQRLEDDGSVRRHEFDAQSLHALRELSRELQLQVFTHIAHERVFLINSRSKSGFLFSLCERARHGGLDVRGLCLPDPWRHVLLAQAAVTAAAAAARARAHQLVPEAEWLDRQGPEPAELLVDVAADTALAPARALRVALRLRRPVAELKARLEAIGSAMPRNRMRLLDPASGVYLRDDRSLAFYNLRRGSRLVLAARTRAGAALQRKRLSVELQDPVAPM